MSRWTFFTNHGHVLIALARDPAMRVRDIADDVGITERAAHRILSDLVEAGYVERQRVGARNRYQINRDLPFRHPLEEGHRVGELLETLVDAEGGARRRREPTSRRSGAAAEQPSHGSRRPRGAPRR